MKLLKVLYYTIGCILSVIFSFFTVSYSASYLHYQNEWIPLIILIVLSMILYIGCIIFGIFIFSQKQYKHNMYVELVGLTTKRIKGVCHFDEDQQQIYIGDVQLLQVFQGCVGKNVTVFLYVKST